MTENLRNQPGIPMRVHFLPGWWRRQYGIRFGRRYYTDPHYRIAVGLEMEKTLHERFGGVGLGDPEPRPRPHLDYGMVFLPEVLGSRIRFFEDNFPAAENRGLSAQEIPRLDMPDIGSSESGRRLASEYWELVERYGPFPADVNPTGVHNLASNLRGGRILLEYTTRPHVADRFVRFAAEAVTQLVRWLRRLTKAAKVPLDDAEPLILPECSLVQIDGDTYRRFILPEHQRIAQALGGIGIHLCDRADAHLEAFAEIPGLAMLDLSARTDLELLQRCLPGVPKRINLEPVFMRHADESQVEGEILRILDAIPREEIAVIGLVGIDDGTPDANIRRALEVVRERTGVVPERAEERTEA